MSVRISIESAGASGGVTIYRVRLRSGTTIGYIEEATCGALRTHTVRGHPIAGLVVCGDTSAPSSLVDAAAAVWLAWMGSARNVDPIDPEFMTDEAR